MQNRYKGFASFDALFCLVPILLMLSLLMQASSSLSNQAQEQSHSQQIFDKLVSVADYTVKIGAVVRYGNETKIRYPNWIDADALSEKYVEDLRTRADLEELSIGFDPPSSPSAFCIYRIVVVGDQKTITKMYVCGG